MIRRALALGGRLAVVAGGFPVATLAGVLIRARPRCGRRGRAVERFFRYDSVGFGVVRVSRAARPCPGGLEVADGARKRRRDRCERQYPHLIAASFSSPRAGHPGRAIGERAAVARASRRRSRAEPAVVEDRLATRSSTVDFSGRTRIARRSERIVVAGNGAAAGSRGREAIARRGEGRRAAGVTSVVPTRCRATRPRRAASVPRVDGGSSLRHAAFASYVLYHVRGSRTGRARPPRRHLDRRASRKSSS